jgi:hypothetical protein
VRLIYGKSLVPSSATDDVFTGVVAERVPFQRAPGFVAINRTEPTLEIGDPWAYYRRFWQAHGLDHLADIVPLEITIHVDGVLAIPLVIDNPSGKSMDVTVSVKAPDGWNVTPVPTATVSPHSQYFLRVQAAAPSTKLPGWQLFSVSAQSANKTIGTVPLRVELSTGWVAPQ